MSIKAIVFIDGSWLYQNRRKLSQAYGEEDFRIDFGKLPRVLADQVRGQMPLPEIDIVRTYLFGAYPSNYDLRDDEFARGQRDFYDLLKEEYHYEVETYPINFRGNRLRRIDRDPNDRFDPEEKCVDIALATTMVYLAALPYAYDVAITVIGDRDFLPVLQHVRRLGKRVAIASIMGSCAREFADIRDESRVKDFDIIWLDHLLDELKLKREKRMLVCQSPTHSRGPREEYTDYYLRKGQKFYCTECRKEFREQHAEAQRLLVGDENGHEFEQEGNIQAGDTLMGTVKSIKPDKLYGFIAANGGADYFFHMTDLVGVEFSELYFGLPVSFEVKKLPAFGKAGAAQNVHPQLVMATPAGAPSGEAPLQIQDDPFDEE
jgi:cold shock CspA family protein